MTPLVLIGAFLSFTELIAGYTLLNTTGNIQLVLVGFVVTFPVLIAAAFFYILAFRNYVLFSPEEFPVATDVRRYAAAMRGGKHDEALYAHAAHALMGVADALSQELPELIKTLKTPRPRALSLESEIRVVKHRPRRGTVETLTHRITVGSVQREDAAVRFPFLADGSTRMKTQRAIQLLTATDENFFFRIRTDGGVHSIVNLNEPDTFTAKPGDPVDVDEFMLVQAITMVQGQLLIAFWQQETLAFPGPRLTQFVAGVTNAKLVLAPGALVISDEGDIFGTLTDVLQRHAATAVQSV